MAKGEIIMNIKKFIDIKRITGEDQEFPKIKGIDHHKDIMSYFPNNLNEPDMQITKKEYMAVALFENNRIKYLHRTKPIYNLTEAKEEVHFYLNHENRLTDDDFKAFIKCEIRVRVVSEWEPLKVYKKID